MKDNVKQRVDGEEWRYVPGEPALLFLSSYGNDRSPVLPLPFSLYYYVSAFCFSFCDKCAKRLKMLDF